MKIVAYLTLAWKMEKFKTPYVANKHDETTKSVFNGSTSMAEKQQAFSKLDQN